VPDSGCAPFRAATHACDDQGREPGQLEVESMAEQRELRVSDGDRQAAAERLRAAHDEGRLAFAEYDDRLAAAYSAVTYGDLDRLFADLPAGRSSSVVRATAAPPARVARPKRQPDGLAVGFARLPIALKILWTIWATAMAINLTVWTLVGVGNGEMTYFWPVWLLIPGVALAGVTAGVTASRAGRELERGPDKE
jgi:hypothetical protein